MPIIYCGCDHAGLDLKNILEASLTDMGYTVEDCGTTTADSCDYPIFAEKVCEKVLASGSSGLLICGTGIGMSMAANRHKGIRAALCGTEIQARLAREHNDANILCLGARITGSELALAILSAFLEGKFAGGRHKRRLDLF